MQNSSVPRIFNLRPAPRNMSLLAALLAAMLVGVAAGYYAGGSSASATSSIDAPSSSIPASSNKAVSADALSVQELRQEQRDLRQAQKAAKISSSTAIEPLDAYSQEKELRQEQSDLRHASAQSAPIQTDVGGTNWQTRQMRILTSKERQLEPQVAPQVPLAPNLGVTFPTRQELWQEHLDLLASRSQIGVPPSGATSVDVGAGITISAYGPYWTAKAKQLQ